MNFRNDSFIVDAPGKAKPLEGLQLNAVMRNVYGWMTMGLLVTATVALAVANSGFFPSQAVLWLAIIAQFGIVLGLSFAIRRISATAAGMLFFVYSALTGFTFSILFLAFSLGSIAAAFFSTAGVFGAMTIVGMTTKTDLTQYRSYFMMGLIGVIIASVINIFIGSSGLDFLISIFGVLLFTGLTAYDTQRIANMAASQQMKVDSQDTLKFSIMGALTLYLDFINLFLFMLRLFGGGRD
ncbi:MAG: Bax inhibitor-1/YccA family protein [Chloroflexota bacterium]|nr:Bax inhibitor-1/YccA family protein [Chloroflexota bacterium]MDE2856035.1 Bax inhibitor-1/YccA family protein [Chloroflexota bacterium]MDE2946473.1 Bax inhibitor-1/YccA family protein [Chloroflexota bacterium]